MTMLINVTSNGVKLTEIEFSSIKEKAKLSLSRFVYLFDELDLEIVLRDVGDDSEHICCLSRTTLTNGVLIESEVTDCEVSEAVNNSLSRIRRNLDRHRKRILSKQSGAF